MQFVYCDAALVSNQGHFANNCRAITSGLRNRGIPHHVLAHRQIEPGLASELGARPHFNVHPNASFSDDPLCGWLKTFTATVQLTVQDLARINGMGVGDILYYDSAKAAQLMALVEWAQRHFTPQTCPRIVASLAWFPGARALPARPGEAPQWAVHDVNSLLYRHAASSIPRELDGRFRLVCLSQAARDVYAFLTGRAVNVLPSPYTAGVPVRDRKGASPVTVAFLGEQRHNKGLGLLPAIVARLLDSGAPVRVLVHNAFTGAVPEMDQLRTLAGEHDGLEVIVQSLGGQAWAELLHRADLIVLPYSQADYANANSGIALEAMANGVPLAVPAGTGMARMLEEFGLPGVVFAESEAEAIVSSVIAAAGRFDDLAARARAAAEQWNALNGPDRIVGKILES